MPDNIAERPLVTFALFAYNQERYIREAVEGAFAQTYEPLEIILSDDCSTDRTFDIICDLVAKYTGPHKIVVRQNELNLGTALHVSAVSRKASGCLIVVAAGDDISKPERTETFVNIWRSKHCPTATMHSGYVAIDDKGDVLREVEPATHEEYLDLKWFLKNRRLPFHAPTCCYPMKLFTDYPNLIGGSVIEDGPLGIRALAQGKFVSVSEPLVLKREHQESVGQGHTIKGADSWNRLILSRIITAVCVSRDAKIMGSLGIKGAVQIERYFLRSARNLSYFLVPTSSKPGIFYRVVLLIRILMFYPTSSLRARAARALVFLELKK